MKGIISYFFIALFSILGMIGFYFAISSEKEIPFYGWIIFGFFLLLPLTFLFKPSQKQIKNVQDRTHKLLYTEKALIIQQPLFDQDKIIDWHTIETIIYANHLTEEKEFILFLNKPSVISHYKKRWWPNRIFNTATVDNNLKVRLYQSWGYFHLMMDEIQQRFAVAKRIELPGDRRKGVLINKITAVDKLLKMQTEHWKPATDQSLWTMIYDIKHKTVDDIYNRDKGI